MHESQEEILQRIQKENREIKSSRLCMLMDHEFAKCRLCGTQLDIKEIENVIAHSLPRVASCPCCGLWFHTLLPEQNGDFSKRKEEEEHVRSD
jgi:hypothetical protein